MKPRGFSLSSDIAALQHGRSPQRLESASRLCFIISPQNAPSSRNSLPMTSMQLWPTRELWPTPRAESLCGSTDTSGGM